MLDYSGALNTITKCSEAEERGRREGPCGLIGEGLSSPFIDLDYEGGYEPKSGQLPETGKGKAFSPAASRRQAALPVFIPEGSILDFLPPNPEIMSLCCFKICGCYRHNRKLTQRASNFASFRVLLAPSFLTKPI